MLNIVDTESSIRGIIQYYFYLVSDHEFGNNNKYVEMTANSADYQGNTLYFYPALLYSYPLAQNINKYGFFAYAVAEALFLSDKEKAIIISLFQAIAFELNNNIDQFSQDVFVSQLGLLLDHSNRFYNRQFLTIKPINHDLTTRMYNYLGAWNNDGNGLLGHPLSAGNRHTFECFTALSL